jgi:hypothetical protein
MFNYFKREKQNSVYSVAKLQEHTADMYYSYTAWQSSLSRMSHILQFCSCHSVSMTNHHSPTLDMNESFYSALCNVSIVS